MPATIEALLILLVFVVPGFITVRTRETIVPTVGKLDALQITLRSVTVSLLYAPLWLLASRDLLVFRAKLLEAARAPGSAEVAMLDRAFLIVLVLTFVVPVVAGGIWARAYWNEWYARAGEKLFPKLGLRTPTRGVGEDLWDKLWLSRERQPWLTVYMKDGRIYVGRGIEFSQSAYGRDLVLGPESRLFDKDGTQLKDLAAAAGQSVWIPAGEVSSIDVHE